MQRTGSGEPLVYVATRTKKKKKKKETTPLVRACVEEMMLLRLKPVSTITVLLPGQAGTYAVRRTGRVRMCSGTSRLMIA
jgi:hypothetical protein